ncbi:MAG: hypothetical protein ABI672_04540 [Vicinamibacteria bacterium]
MTLLATPFALPQAELLSPEGAVVPTVALYAGGPTLVLFGHKNCKTTRQTIPYIDRIHKDGGRARLVLQDTPAEAVEALDKLGATIPFFSEADPYALSTTLGLVTVPTLLFIEADGTVSQTSEAFRRADIEAFATKLGAPRPVLENDVMPGFKPG